MMEFRFNSYFSDTVYYIDSTSKENSVNTKIDSSKGITVYGTWNLIGLVLNCFGWVQKTKIGNGVEVYVSNNSLINYAARIKKYCRQHDDHFPTHIEAANQESPSREEIQEVISKMKSVSADTLKQLVMALVKPPQALSISPKTDTSTPKTDTTPPKTDTTPPKTDNAPVPPKTDTSPSKTDTSTRLAPIPPKTDLSPVPPKTDDALTLPISDTAKTDVASPTHATAPATPSTLITSPSDIRIVMSPRDTAASSMIVVSTNEVFLEPLKTNKALKKAFEIYLRANNHENKRTVINQTILDSQTQLSDRITFDIVTGDDDEFDVLLRKPNPSLFGSVDSTPDWYRNEPGHYIVDFADPTFGGGYCSRVLPDDSRDSGESVGFVQEEREFYMKPELAALDFLTRYASHPISPGKHDNPTPFIIYNVQHQWDIDPTLYSETTLREADSKTLPNRIQRNTQNPSCHVIGLVAKRFRFPGRDIALSETLYQKTELFKYLKGCYLGFNQAGQGAYVDSGAWGCGAFNNSEKMMIAIQTLAAMMTGVKLKLHGVREASPFNPDFTPANVKAIKEMIEGYFKEGISVDQMLERLLKLQETDPTWRPKIDAQHNKIIVDRRQLA